MSMKKNHKIILICINLLMLGFAFLWFNKEKSYEPIIVMLGQVAALFTIFWDDKNSKIITKRVTQNSQVDIDVNKGDNINTSDVSDSNVKIKTRN